MQSGRIKASQLSASSSWDRNHAPNNGRLHLHRVGARMGAWCARHNNRLQWYQVNFGRPTRVVKFAIQGRQDARQWVTQCYLSYSQDGIHYAEFKENSNRKVRVVDYFFHVEMKYTVHKYQNNYKTSYKQRLKRQMHVALLCLLLLLGTL